MNHVSLFSGIGGIDLAAEWAGFKTVAFVEKDEYCQKVLKKHWPDVPIHQDITTFKGSDIDEPITLISGGFPCQPFSIAGKRRGTKDDRYLWPEMLRVIQEIRPAWVLGENVAHFFHMGLDQALSDLEAAGYEATTFSIPAVGVDAPHLRYRIFFVGYSECKRQFQSEHEKQSRYKERPFEGPSIVAYAIGQRGWKESITNPRSSHQAESENDGKAQSVADDDVQRCKTKRSTESIQTEYYATQCRDWWSLEPDVGRVAHGIPHRVDRLRCLGNVVVPQQVYPILKAIAECEMTGRN